MSLTFRYHESLLSRYKFNLSRHHESLLYMYGFNLSKHHEHKPLQVSCFNLPLSSRTLNYNQLIIYHIGDSHFTCFTSHSKGFTIVTLNPITLSNKDQHDNIISESVSLYLFIYPLSLDL